AHHVRLWGRAPKALALSVDERWPGDPRRGEAIIEGSYRFAGETVASADPPWDPGLGSADWQAELDGFAWPAHIAAVGRDSGGGESPRAAQELARAARPLASAHLARRRHGRAALCLDRQRGVPGAGGGRRRVPPCVSAEPRSADKAPAPQRRLGGDRPRPARG